MQWPLPFSPIERLEDKPKFELELSRELKSGHPLFGVPVVAIGWRADSDDVLFEILNNNGAVAEVHLTWAGERERPPWPGTVMFNSFEEWAESVRKDS